MAGWEGIPGVAEAGDPRVVPAQQRAIGPLAADQILEHMRHQAGDQQTAQHLVGFAAQRARWTKARRGPEHRPDAHKNLLVGEPSRAKSRRAAVAARPDARGADKLARSPDLRAKGEARWERSVP